MAITLNGGTGVITGVSVGGLPDGVVDAGTLATNSVDSDELVSGAVDSAHFASGVGGKILQVVAGSSGALGTMSSTTSWTGCPRGTPHRDSLSRGTDRSRDPAR